MLRTYVADTDRGCELDDLLANVKTDVDTRVTGTYTVRRTVGSGSGADWGFKLIATLLGAADSLLSPEHPTSVRLQASMNPVRPATCIRVERLTLVAARVP